MVSLQCPYVVYTMQSILDPKPVLIIVVSLFQSVIVTCRVKGLIMKSLIVFNTKLNEQVFTTPTKYTIPGLTMISSMLVLNIDC